MKGKISDKELDLLRAVLSRNADVFSKHKADIGCCNFVEHQIEIEEGSVPHREGARRMTPHKSEACRKEIEMLMEYDMIEPSKSPWACGMVMAKKKGGQLRMTSNLKRWIENGAPDKRDLEEDSYKILKQFYLKRKHSLYLNKDGIVACKRREEDKVLYKYNSIVLPQLYQTELLFRSHDQMGHQVPGCRRS